LSRDDTLLLEANLTELFEPILLEVLDEVEFKISNHSYLYLLELLTSYGIREPQGPDRSEEQMLSERLLKAIGSTEKREKAKSLRSLAETSLIKVGFFSSSLKRKIVGVRYHMDIGVMAYSHLYSTTKEPTYEEASERFPDYADILSGVRERLNLSKEPNSDIIGAFEWYRETGSKKAEEELIKKGVPLTSSKKASNQ
jgi:hypothetical protein